MWQWCTSSWLAWESILSVLVRLPIVVISTWKQQFKRGNTYFGSWLQGSVSLVLGFIDSGPTVRQNIMAAGACVRSCSPLGSQEAKREGTEDQIWPSKVCSQWPSPSATFQNSSTSWGPSIQHMSLWGTFHIQIITKSFFPPMFIYRELLLNLQLWLKGGTSVNNSRSLSLLCIWVTDTFWNCLSLVSSTTNIVSLSQATQVVPPLGISHGHSVSRLDCQEQSLLGICFLHLNLPFLLKTFSS
jgi:hypothetical protein